MNTSFKLALASLLDDTETFSRKEWANYLLVSEPAISQWTKGKTMPRAEYLRSILLYLENFERETVQHCLYKFHQIADLPIARTLDADLQVRYRKFHTITEYISNVYKDGLETELMDMQGVFRKELYYLFSSLARVTKEVADDFAEFNNSLVLTKALRSITHKQLREWFTTILMKQVEPFSEGSHKVKANHVSSTQNHLDFNFNPVVHRDRVDDSFCEIIKPLRHSITCAPMTYAREIYNKTSSDVRQMDLQTFYFDLETVISINKERCYLERMSAGDWEGFKGIYDLYCRDVFRYLSSKSIILTDVEDIFTNVFLTLWRDRLRLNDWGVFRTHLFRLSDTYFQLYQLNQIKSTIEDKYAITCVIDKDLQDGLEAVNKFDLLKAQYDKMTSSQNAETKRKEEWDAIHSIFSTETHSIKGISRPDFIVTRKADDYTIGVEVTSLYFHMGSARLKRDARYLRQVLDGNPHPQDIPIMRKDTIVLLDQADENGNEISFDAVLYDHVGWAEFIDLLGQEIDKKSKKYASYQGPVSRISLIIVDEENFFSSWNLDQVSVHLFQSPAFKEIVTSCVFHEVFLITNVNGDRSYIPLKQALFFADYKTIVSFYYRKLMSEVGLEKIISVFIHLMIRSGHSNMKAFKENEKVFFFHQNLLIQIDKEKLRQEFMKDSTLFDFLDPVSKIVWGPSDQASESLYTDYMEFKKDMRPLLDIVIHKLATQ